MKLEELTDKAIDYILVAIDTDRLSQWEFYRPTDAELSANYSGDALEGMREHVAKGGLDLRPRTKKTPVMHPE